MYRNKLNDSIYWVGVNDYDTDLFESIWPIPDGVSYNSYLIDDEKVALFDTVKESFFSRYLNTICNVLNGRPVDYLIIHHLEPDHSGSIRMLKQAYPGMKVVGNAKTIEFLSHMFEDVNDIVEIKDLDELHLGKTYA